MYVLNFSSRKNFDFPNKFPEKDTSGQKLKKLHHQCILDIRISLSTSFQLKVTYFFVLDQLCAKRVANSSLKQI